MDGSVASAFRFAFSSAEIVPGDRRGVGATARRALGVATEQTLSTAMSPSGEFASSPAPTASGGRTDHIPAWLGAILRVPLAIKLAGANAVIVLAALISAVALHLGGASEVRFLVILAVAMIGSVVVNLLLVALALRPLADLESTARRIWEGDLSARVPKSRLADGNLLRIGEATNSLLDGLTADRARLRELTARVITAGDEERSHIARELHDSTAQSLAALLMELSVVAHATRDAGARERLERIRRIVGDVLDEVRLLSQTVHPRVLDDLGLGAALQHLSREAEARGSVRVEVVVEDSAAAVSPSVSSVLYRVAQEALKNALRHAHATAVLLRAGVQGGIARLEISDDGIGFRADEAERRRPGMGLFTMRERMALVSGILEIDSAPGRGTRIVASVPLLAPASAGAPGEAAGT